MSECPRENSENIMSSVKKFNDLNTANTLCVRRAPYNSGFARKTRAKPLEFQVGLYCNDTALKQVAEIAVTAGQKYSRQHKSDDHASDMGGLVDHRIAPAAVEQINGHQPRPDDKTLHPCL